MNFKKHLVAITSIALIAGSITAIGLFSSKTQAQGTPAAAPTAKAALTVSSVSPSSGSLALKLGANGSVAAWQEASIGAEVNGLKLTDVRVNVGDVVRKGQVLATFSTEGIIVSSKTLFSGIAGILTAPKVRTGASSHSKQCS